MKRIVRLTESDLTRIVKRVIFEQNSSGNQFCAICKEWEDTDDSVYREGKWMVKGNQIIINYRGTFGNDSETISKPNGFDSWAKGVKNGKFIGNPENKDLDLNPFNDGEDSYQICFTKTI